MPKGSFWKERARVIIQQTLDALPEGATRAEALKALREAYTRYADEEMGWAHKAWCAVRVAELRKRGLDDPNTRRPTRMKVIGQSDVKVREDTLFDGETDA